MSKQLILKIIQPFIDGTLTTLQVQCHTPAQQMKSYIKGTKDPFSSDIAGMIGITSAEFNGSICLCFPEATFLAVMGGMLGEKYDKITPDLEDGAGELMNIIFGYGKRVLNQEGYTLEKALPSVIRGSSLQVRHMKPGPAVVIPFQTESGLFYIEIAVQSLVTAA
jgi:chemotaxis protein CheX